ncbi:MAG: T9SS type A sorting domain-containing protein, partial [Bacteroidota bacterium]
YIYVTVTTYDGCTGIDESVIQVYDDAGINEYSNADISIFPNPAVSRISISGVLPSDDTGIAITDEFGRIVIYRNHLTPAEIHAVDVSQLSSGMYNVRITSTNFTKVMKFIKQ